MITLLKLGGSLITDKTKRSTFHQEEMKRLATEIRKATQQLPDLKLIIGHGSGSFGHFEAKEHGTMQGVHTPEQWRGFASVATVASELSHYVTQELYFSNVPVLRFQPSASAIANDGVIVSMAIEQIETAVKHGLVPLVHGDIAFDSVRGGTIISTETIFAYLVAKLPVSRILLLGDVDGVYNTEGEVIPHITPQNIKNIEGNLGGSSGVDVTGGMLTKVHDSLALATKEPYPVIQIINGKAPNRLYKALCDDSVLGTTITKH